MNEALIGYTGFVGSTLLKQHTFDGLYRSTNIGEIDHRHFSLVVCAGAPAQKWMANQNPQKDSKKINNLIEHLKTIQADCFVLISTVDVFKNPVHVNEQTLVDVEDLHAYGLHRRELEQFVEHHFANHLIVRLPGLVGAGLRKNIIFDLHNNHNVDAVDSRATFQFYPMHRLWHDIQIALSHHLKLVHLTAQPITVAEVALKGFGINFTNVLSKPSVHYDMQSVHASLFHGDNGYQYNKNQSIEAVRAYAQSEPKK